MTDNDACLYDGRFLQIRRRGRWEYVTRRNARGAAFILALTNVGEIVLVEQYRVPVAARVIELPAGIIGDSAATAGEDAKQTAVRELEEETGFRGARIRHRLHSPSSPGMAAERLDLFEITGLQRIGPGGGVDEGEDITVHVVPLVDAPAWLRRKEAAGLLIDSRVYTGLWFADHPED